MTLYGIISDAHTAPLPLVYLAIDQLKEKGCDALVLNGDISGEYNGKVSSAEYLTSVLSRVVSSGLETYIVPGSNDGITDFCAALRAANAVDVKQVHPVWIDPIIEKEDHTLVFLSGLGFVSTLGPLNSFLLSAKFPTGLFRSERGLVYSTNIESVLSCIKDPDKAVVFSHIPMQFQCEETIDYVTFIGAKEPFIWRERLFRQGEIIPKIFLDELLSCNLPVEQMKANAGSSDLKSFFEKYGIRKQITGHIHEAVHRAHNLLGSYSQEGEFTDELFWMASYLDQGKVGILYVNGKEVAYENVLIRNENKKEQRRM